MKFAYFNIFGYLSIILWLVMLALWVLHVARRPRRWWCHLALMVGILAFVCAKINSVTYVNLIQEDQSEAIAAAQARQQAARKAAEDARKGEVAQIRFAEDDADDFLDKAGMDEADKKYLENAGKTKAEMNGGKPAWKREKQHRSSGAKDDSLEGLLNTRSDQKKDTLDEVVAQERTKEPVIMPAADKEAANRLDALNLKWIKILLLLGIVFCVVDYLRRFNVYHEAYLPLPLPSAATNSLTSMPAIWSRPDPPRRTIDEELAWLSRRGDAFVYITDDDQKAGKIPAATSRLPFGLFPVDVLRADSMNPLIDDTFVVESLWYNRSSFVIDSSARAEAFLDHVLEKLRNRKHTRARTRQTVHVVWDMDRPIPENIRSELVKIAQATGWSILEAGKQCV